MIWTATGGGLVLYELYAIASRRIPISTLAHRWPWSFVVLGWWAGLGIHFFREWRRDRPAR